MSYQAMTEAFKILGNAYPTARKADQEMLDVWASAVASFPSSAIVAAAHRWALREARFPVLATFRETCALIARESQGERSLTRGDCPQCEGTGWVYTSLEGRTTVRRCPNGCQPAPMGGDPDDWRMSASERALGMHEIAELADRLGSMRREAAVGGDAANAYMSARGFDSTEFWVKDGMILRRMPERTAPAYVSQTGGRVASRPSAHGPRCVCASCFASKQ